MHTADTQTMKWPLADVGGLYFKDAADFHTNAAVDRKKAVEFWKILQAADILLIEQEMACLFRMQKLLGWATTRQLLLLPYYKLNSVHSNVVYGFNFWSPKWKKGPSVFQRSRKFCSLQYPSSKPVLPTRISARSKIDRLLRWSMFRIRSPSMWFSLSVIPFRWEM